MIDLPSSFMNGGWGRWIATFWVTRVARAKGGEKRKMREWAVIIYGFCSIFFWKNMVFHYQKSYSKKYCLLVGANSTRSPWNSTLAITSWMILLIFINFRMPFSFSSFLHLLPQIKFINFFIWTSIYISIRDAKGFGLAVWYGGFVPIYPCSNFAIWGGGREGRIKKIFI